MYATNPTIALFWLQVGHKHHLLEVGAICVRWNSCRSISIQRWK